MEKWIRLLVIVATTLLLITLVAVGVHLLLFIHHTLLLFALGALVAYALDPVVEGLRRTRLMGSRNIPSRQYSVAAVFLGLALLIGLGVWSLEGHLMRQVTAIQEDVTYQTRAMTFAQSLDQKLAAYHLHFSLVRTIQNPPPDVKATIHRAGGEVLPFLKHLGTDVGETVIVLLIALYFLIFGGEMREKFNGLLPGDLAGRAEAWETDVNRILGGFVRGQFIIALIMGAAAAVGCLAIGIKLWLIIGLFVVAASLIPVFGPYLGAVPAILAALIEPTRIHNPIAAAVFVLLYFILINEIGSKVLYPKLVGAALGLHEVLVLFVLFAGLEINGIVGVLFAAPVTALAIVTAVHLYRLWQDLPDQPLSNVTRQDARRAKAQMDAPGTKDEAAALPASPLTTPRAGAS